MSPKGVFYYHQNTVESPLGFATFPKPVEFSTTIQQFVSRCQGVYCSYTEPSLVMFLNMVQIDVYQVGTGQSYLFEGGLAVQQQLR